MQKKINTMPKKNIKIIIKNIEISKIQSWHLVCGDDLRAGKSVYSSNVL
jgi:hypothetical protein